MTDRYKWDHIDKLKLYPVCGGLTYWFAQAAEGIQQLTHYIELRR